LFGAIRCNREIRCWM